MKIITIINTGGTFNKVYNSSNGILEVPKNNKALEDILNKLYKSNNKPQIIGKIYKDSLEINNKHRDILVNIILNIKKKNIIIIHGTDTMNKTAKYLSKRIKNKKIVLVGAMIPYSYEKVEASTNLTMAIGFLNAKVKNNIYICMNGIIKKHNKIKKNYELGVFECQ